MFTTSRACYCDGERSTLHDQQPIRRHRHFASPKTLTNDPPISSGDDFFKYNRTIQDPKECFPNLSRREMTLGWDPKTYEGRA